MADHIHHPCAPARGRAMAGVLAAAMAVGLASPATAQEARAPQGNIEITVGSSAGATPDIIMRRFAQVLSSEGIVENPLAVVNRTGGAWTVASNYVIGQAGNEQVLFSLVPTVFTTPILQGTENTWDQFTPLAYLVTIDLVVATRADAPFDTLEELVEIAREEPFGVIFGGANVGSTDHTIAALIEQATGVEFNYIPFDGGGGATAALLGGNIDVLPFSVEEVAPLIEAGELKALAIFNQERRVEPELAHIPTAIEQGIDMVWHQNFGVVAPPDLDPAVVAWWDERLAELSQNQAWLDALSDAYLRSGYTDSAETAVQMADFYERYRAVAVSTGLAEE